MTKKQYKKKLKNLKKQLKADIKESKKNMSLYEDRDIQQGWLRATSYWLAVLEEKKWLNK